MMERKTATPSASYHRNRLPPRRLSEIEVMMPSTSKMKQQERNWLDLPSDVMVNIFKRIGMVDILENVQNVCTDWHKICKDPALWRVINMKDILSSVAEISNMDGLPNLQLVERMGKQAVHRSQGQLVDITIYHDYDGVVFKYAAERSSQLRRLELASSVWFRYRTENVLMKFQLLEEFNLYDTIILKEHIETLGRYCPMLKTLKVNAIAFMNDSDSDDIFCEYLDVIAIAIGQNLVGLRHLELIGNKMTNKGLQVILDNCHHLETLDLRGCYNIDLKGDLGKKCSQQIKHLKLPNDSLKGCPYYNKQGSESSAAAADDDDDYDLSDDDDYDRSDVIELYDY